MTKLLFQTTLSNIFANICIFLKIHFFKLLQDIYDVEERMGPGGPGGSGGSNKINSMPIYKNHLVRVQDLGKTWKLKFDINLFKRVHPLQRFLKLLKFRNRSL